MVYYNIIFLERGVDMSKFCPNCGKELENGVKFCASCGKAVDADSTATQSTTPVTNVNVNVQNESNGMATAGFVVSLVSWFLCCGSFSWLSLIFSIVGLVQSKSKNDKGKGLAIAGIIISALALLSGILLTITGTVASVMEEM